MIFQNYDILGIEEHSRQEETPACFSNHSRNIRQARKTVASTSEDIAITAVRCIEVYFEIFLVFTAVS